MKNLLKSLTLMALALTFMQCKHEMSFENKRVTSKMFIKISKEDLLTHNITDDSLAKYNLSYENGYVTHQIIFPHRTIILSNGDSIRTDKDSYINIPWESNIKPVKIILDKNTYDLKEIDNKIVLICHSI